MGRRRATEPQISPIAQRGTDENRDYADFKLIFKKCLQSINRAGFREDSSSFRCRMEAGFAPTMRSIPMTRWLDPHPVGVAQSLRRDPRCCLRRRPICARIPAAAIDRFCGNNRAVGSLVAGTATTWSCLRDFYRSTGSCDQAPPRGGRCLDGTVAQVPPARTDRVWGFAHC